MDSALKSLTARQLQLLELLHRGFSNQDICRFLKISPNTVKVHLANIYRTLEVSNRTEAALLYDQKIHLCKPCDGNKNGIPCLTIHLSQDVLQHTEATLFVRSLSIRLQRLETIKVGIISEQEEQKEKGDFSLQVDFDRSSASRCLQIFLHHHSCQHLCWSTIQGLSSKDSSLDLVLDRLSLQIQGAVEKTAALIYEEHTEYHEYWWYAVMFCMQSMTRRNPEVWRKSVDCLEPFTKTSLNEPLLYACLAQLWYKAFLERWAEPKQAVHLLKEYAALSVRIAPNSSFSQLVFAFHLNLDNKYQESVRYLEYCLEINPLCVVAMQLLFQIYSVSNMVEKGIAQMRRLEDLVPAFFQNPNHMASAAVFYFVNGQYEKCCQICEQALEILPDSLASRLLMIACLVNMDCSQAVKHHLQQLDFHHPDFSLREILPLLEGIHPVPLQKILDSLAEAGLNVNSEESIR